MSLHMLKIAVVGIMVVGNTALLITSLVCHRRRCILPAAYYVVVSVIQFLAVAQVAVGLWFLYRGYPLQLMHLIYGLLVFTGACLHEMLKPTRALGQIYRNRPLAHAALGLFVLLVVLRSWLSARSW